MGRVVGAMVAVNEEVKFLWKFKKKWDGVECGGVSVDVNGEVKFL